jgi:hypothetical protein
MFYTNEEAPNGQRDHNALVVGDMCRVCSVFKLRLINPFLILGGDRPSDAMRIPHQVCMDRHAPDHYVETAEESLQDTEAFIRWVQEELQSPLVHPVVTPRCVACGVCFGRLDWCICVCVTLNQTIHTPTHTYTQQLPPHLHRAPTARAGRDRSAASRCARAVPHLRERRPGRCV